MHKDKQGPKKKRAEVPPQPPLLPAVTPGGILELLSVQKRRAEELLKSDFLSIEDVRYWNLFTKEILTKAFGARPEYIEAVLYVGEQKPFSAYEPESSLEKMRRRNFEIALRRLGACMKKLNPASSKADAEDEEPDDLEEGAEEDGPEEGEEEEGEEEEMKAPPERKDPVVEAGMAERPGKSNRRVFLLPGIDDGKKKEITRFLKNMDLEAVLPPEPPQEGNWMEELGRGSQVAFALAVLSDESARPEHDRSDAKPRLGVRLAFELGFVAGRLKPGLICVLYEKGFDLPVHLPGGLFLPWDSAGLWKLLVARTMKMANVDVDLNKAL